MSHVLLLWVVSVAIGADALAFNCLEALSGAQKRNIQLSAISVPDATLSDLERVLQLLSEDDLKWVYANLFFDRNQIAVSQSRENESLISLWDPPGSLFKFRSPYRRFKDAFEKFILIPSARNERFGRSIVLDFHRALMKGGIEGIEASEIGVIRKRAVVFRIFQHQYSQTKAQLDRNPYLKFGEVESGGMVKILYPEADQVPALLDEAFIVHETDLKKAKSLTERIRAHSDFVWRFVSIHPFGNGNGRTSRFILSFLLAQEGLPLPILADSVDLTLSRDRYFEKVLWGLHASRAFLADLQWRLREGLDIKKSPYNLISKLPKNIWFESEGLKGKKAAFPVDLYDYVQFVRDHAQGEPPETIRLKEYVEWVKKWSVHFIENGGDIDLYQVKRIPDEIMDLWQNGARSLTDSEGLRAFYQNFYETESLHRGLSLQRTLSDEELISYFKTTQTIYLSMRASRSGGSISSIIDDFKLFNKLMEKPAKLLEYTRDHMNAEGLYSQSPFNSTAKVIPVARRFSRGFMMNPQWIQGMKGELIVSAYRPKYGVMDLNRLREISSKAMGDAFKSNYPRQQEVSVAGSLHPASVTRVEFTDVTVQSIEQNSGEYIAGKDTIVRLKRVLERLPEDPMKIRFQKLDSKGNVISEEIISL